jgi:uncharacterized membrane protein
VGHDVLIAAGGQVTFDVLVGIHVVVAIVGFGSVALSGIYGGLATRAGRPGAHEEIRRYFASPGRLELLVVAAPLVGVAAVASEPGATRFGQAWVAMALALWVLASVLLFGVVRPAEAVLRRTVSADAVGEDGDEQAGDGQGGNAPLPIEEPDALRRAGARLRWGAASSDLVFVVALVVMVIRPGS